jgi:hypothetical protein
MKSGCELMNCPYYTSEKVCCYPEEWCRYNLPNETEDDEEVTEVCEPAQS